MKNLKGISFILLSILLLQTSCKDKSNDELVINPCGIDFESTLHYTAIGDDFADGTTMYPDSTVGYYTKEFLLEVGHNITEFEELYVPGATAGDLLFSVNAENITCSNLMTMIVGTNDVLNNTDVPVFRQDFRALLNKCISITGSTDLVTTMRMPNFSVLPGLPASAGTPEQVAARIVEFNTIIQEEAEALGVTATDVSPLTNSIYSNGFGFEPASEGGDDFHPDLLILKAWANTMALFVSEGL